jgi:hypothetical protein
MERRTNDGRREEDDTLGDSCRQRDILRRAATAYGSHGYTRLVQAAVVALG